MKEIVFLTLNKIINTFRGSIFAKIPGVNYIANLVYAKTNPKKIVLINVQGNKMYVDTNDTAIVYSLMTTGFFEEYETEIFKKLIDSDTILIDIGANIGYYSVIGASIIKEGQIYSFEPEPHNFKLLSKNIEINNFNNVILINKAVSNENGNKMMFTDSKNYGAHSLSQNNIIDINNSIKVETITLDSFFSDINLKGSNIFLKIDTQGAEGLIIEGSTSILTNNDINSVNIMMEFWPKGLNNMRTNPKDLLSKLRAFGFEIWAIDEINHVLDKKTDMEIMSYCEIHDDTIDFINLLLKKGSVDTI